MNNYLPKKLFLNKIIIKNFGVIILCLILISPLLISPLGCLAQTGDMIPIGDIVSPWPGPEPKSTPLLIQTIRFLAIVYVDFMANAFVLIIGYLILKRITLIKSWKFLKYIVFATIGGALIDLIFVGGQYLSRFKGPLYPDMELISIVSLVSVLLTFLGLALYNYWLSKNFFIQPKNKLFLSG